MMWKLWHKLFGWKYGIVVYGYSKYVEKIHRLPNGKLCYIRHGDIHVVKPSEIEWVTESYDN